MFVPKVSLVVLQFIADSPVGGVAGLVVRLIEARKRYGQEWDFSTLTLLTSVLDNSLFQGATLGIIGCLSVSLASIH